MKNLKHLMLLLLSFFFCSIELFSQGWVQTAGTPQGSGVTDMLVRNNGWVYATTGSYSWPSVPGGVRVSTDEGVTWQNQTTSYVARTITEGTDGNLYASIWPDPSLFPSEGLYRSTNNGVIWSPLGFVQTGDNIFSIALSATNPTPTIFAGTRNGVIRSTDNGTTFQNASSGIPPNSWVWDLAVDSNGIVAAATTNGVFISSDNGSSWNIANGIGQSDTVVSLKFVYLTSNESSQGRILIAGTSNGNVYQALENLTYLTFSFVAWLSGDEVFAFFVAYAVVSPYYTLFAATYPKTSNGGGIYRSTDQRNAFVKENDGLPSNPKVSGFSGRQITRDGLSFSTENFEAYCGLFENTNNGAKIYKRTFVLDVKRISSEIPGEFLLYQNYPNPFNPSTTVRFTIPSEQKVSIKIYNSLGENISTLVDERLSAGSYEFKWNAEKLTSGVYFYTLVAGNFSETKKLILLK